MLANKYEVLIAGAQVHFLLFLYVLLFLHFSDTPYIALWYIMQDFENQIEHAS